MKEVSVVHSPLSPTTVSSTAGQFQSPRRPRSAVKHGIALLPRRRLSALPPDARVGAWGKLALAPLVVLASFAARADVRALDWMDMQSLLMESCALHSSESASSDQTISSAADCVGEQALAQILDAAVHYMDEYGKQRFGPYFHMDNRLSMSATGEGMRGDFDAVIPLDAFSSVAEGETDRAAFVQTGLTRWRDERGMQRNDLRYGLVSRFTISDLPDTGHVGVSTFLQQNLERGHQRIVAGLDYAGRWGSGALNHYTPTTRWLPGRPGYEERVLAGTELSLGLDATDTIALNAATGRWEADDGSDAWETRIRLGIDWRPHPWLQMGSEWGRTDNDDESVGVLAVISIPFGGPAKSRPRWRGLGLSGRVEGGSPPDLWRSFANEGSLQIAERTVSLVTSDVTQGQPEVTAQFLQDDADSGDAIRVEVTLSSPASADTRVSVQLTPGDGDNPAVPGEDYVDVPVEVTIAQGETSAVASFQLLQNPDNRTARSLGVTASIVS